ncbi:MAG: histidine--tRNA ligase, partial [Pseudomonadales bacterium]
NPLRILDSKSEKTQAILKDAPQLPDFLDDESKADFEALCGYLDDNAIPYTVNPKIVRGLDYYNKTVFEWNTNALGAQGTVCGGGRYDSLVELLGGKPTEGIGFAMGLDRLALMLESGFAHKAGADIYIVSQGEGTRAKALSVGELLRTELAKKTELANKKVVVHCGAGKLKAQMKKADASGASLAVIIGESELAAAVAGVKSLHEQGDEQTQVPQKELAKYCADYFLKSR